MDGILQTLDEHGDCSCGEIGRMSQVNKTDLGSGLGEATGTRTDRTVICSVSIAGPEPKAALRVS
jgi:hypothetical protein